MSLQTFSPAVRLMSENDIQAILDTQAACYPPSMQEAQAVLLARLALAPHTCWVWSWNTAQAAHQPAAYLFSYPSKKGAITPLDQPFHIPAVADCLYLHDLAVTPAARGKRAANALVAAALAHARDAGLPWSALVSVQESQRFWNALGYRASDVQHSPARESLASYQVSADQPSPVYMLQQLL